MRCLPKITPRARTGDNKNDDIDDVDDYVGVDDCHKHTQTPHTFPFGKCLQSMSS